MRQRKFYHEKEVLLGKRVLSREGGSIIAKDYYEEGVVLWKKTVFFDKEVLVWKKEFH